MNRPGDGATERAASHHLYVGRKPRVNRNSSREDRQNPPTSMSPPASPGIRARLLSTLKRETRSAGIVAIGRQASIGLHVEAGLGSTGSPDDWQMNASHIKN